MALRRFSSIYGTPKTILSDNGRNFLGASRGIREAMSNPEFRDYLKNQNIAWEFQTPRAPWCGGHFERMIGVVKTSLAVSLRNRTLNEEEFRTAIAEAQAVVNSRPLTYFNNDVNDEPLTPMHLLRGTAVMSLPPLPICEEEPSQQARRNHSQLVDALHAFRKRWRREYLTSLIQRHERLQGHQAPLRVGEIVLLQDANVVRYNWPLARVLAVFPDPKGIVRKVRVLCRGEEYLRPVSKLVRLELDSEDAVNQLPNEEASETADSVQSGVEEERYDDFENESLQEVPPGIEPNEPCELDSRDDETSVVDDSTATPRQPAVAVRPVRRAAARQRERLTELIEQDLL